MGENVVNLEKMWSIWSMGGSTSCDRKRGACPPLDAEAIGSALLIAAVPRNLSSAGFFHDFGGAAHRNTSVPVRCTSEIMACSRYKSFGALHLLEPIASALEWGGFRQGEESAEPTPQNSMRCRYLPVKKISKFCVAIFCCLTCAASAQSSASAVLDRNMVETGDTFGLRVLVAGTNVAPQRVDFSAWKGLLPPENVLSQSAWTRSGGRWMRHITLIAFDSGTLQLPPLTVRNHLGEAVPTNPLQLTVYPTPANVENADPIRDIRREPIHWTDYWLEALTVLLLLTLIGWYFRRKKPKPVAVVVAVPRPTPVVPPHEVALQKLEVLERQKPWKHGTVEQFYADLSMIVREYLEKRFSVPALESTTREIIPMLAQTNFDQKFSKPLREILYEADMAKYAQQLPAEQACENSVKAVRRLLVAIG